MTDGSGRFTLNKYEYFGEYDLVRLAFLMDHGILLHGLASQPVFGAGERGVDGTVLTHAAIGSFLPFYADGITRGLRASRGRGRLRGCAGARRTKEPIYVQRPIQFLRQCIAWRGRCTKAILSLGIC